MTAAHWALTMEHEDVASAILETNNGYLAADNTGTTVQLLLDGLKELNTMEETIETPEYTGIEEHKDKQKEHKGTEEYEDTEEHKDHKDTEEYEETEECKE